ncbi:MAG: glycosyltransferase [Cyanobium sp. CZS 48M]|nr:glycosyltransferase [Cyanobium sp. CZS48M]
MTGSGRAPLLLLLLGMHRSGTSLLGSLLPPLGVALPGELIDGDRHNPEGYYEREDITALQERLLIDLGRWWPSADGVLPLPGDWLEAPCTRAVRERLLQILANEQRHQVGPWAVKDPRTSLLLPLWREVADQLGLPLRLVLGVRDPAEVMLSLVQRDSQPAGMTPWRAQQLWWRHNRQVLLDGAGLPLLIVHYDAWFQPTSAGRQLDRLARFCGVEPATDATRAAALGRIHPEHRRSLPQASLPLALHTRVEQLHQDLLSLARRDPEAADRPGQRLRRSLAAPELTSLEPDWSLPQRLRRRLGQPAAAAGSAGEAVALPSSHPWRAAALACAGGDSVEAGQQLQHWLIHGLSAHDLERIQQAPAGFFPSPPQDPSPRALWPPRGRVVGLGTHLRDWKLHAWLQHCPLPAGFELLEAEPDAADAAAVAALHLAQVPNGAPSLTLIAWSALPLILDPHPQRARLLQRLGLRAHPLEPSAGTTDWLDREGDLAAASARLGLPPPEALRAFMAQGAERGEPPILCLGTAGGAWEQALDPSLACLPGFDGLQVATIEDARLLASWLDTASRTGLQLVRLDPQAETSSAVQAELAARVGGALRPPDPGSQRPWLPIQVLTAPLSPSELREELRWRWSGRPAPVQPITPRPEVVSVWEGGRGGDPAAVAVCVSLFNYAAWILIALESAHRQSAPQLELIVVDDGSSDDGVELVRTWMEAHGERFSRCSLLAHATNGGLAAARNTAFAATEAPWCFVLDADNALHPQAVASCLAVAEASPPDTAVVHPLVMVHGEGAAGSAPPPTLLSRESWQRGLLEGGNQIDAMALVRRSAWDAVSGYSHIEGGWEDYDFWCKLIEAGFHGVLCPQPLATYRAHGQSMTATATSRGLRRISRLLQARHPWLKLPWATDDVQQEVD